MHVSEIRVKQICVNQGLGALEISLRVLFYRGSSGFAWNYNFTVKKFRLLCSDFA